MMRDNPVVGLLYGTAKCESEANSRALRRVTRMRYQADEKMRVSPCNQ